MKIKLSELESYYIDIKDEINAEDFLLLMNKLNKVLKILMQDPINSFTIKNEVVENIIKKDGRGTHKGPRDTTILYRYDRNYFIQLLKLHYFGSASDKQKFMKQFNKVWSDQIGRDIYNLKKKFKIDSKEIGLIKYPKDIQEFKKINKLKLENQ